MSYTTLKKEKMTRLQLLELGFEYKGINARGTETFTIDGRTIKSYESGYVRNICKKTKTWYGETITPIYQLNLKQIGGKTSRALLPNVEDRYDRIADWNTNRLLRTYTPEGPRRSLVNRCIKLFKELVMFDDDVVELALTKLK